MEILFFRKLSLTFIWHLHFRPPFQDLHLFKISTPKQLMPLQTDTSNTVDSGYFSCPVLVTVQLSHSCSAPLIFPHKSTCPATHCLFVALFHNYLYLLTNTEQAYDYFPPGGQQRLKISLPYISHDCCFSIRQEQHHYPGRKADSLSGVSEFTSCSVFLLLSLIQVN